MLSRTVCTRCSARSARSRAVRVTLVSPTMRPLTRKKIANEEAVSGSPGVHEHGAGHGRQGLREESGAQASGQRRDHDGRVEGAEGRGPRDPRRRQSGRPGPRRRRRPPARRGHIGRAANRCARWTRVAARGDALQVGVGRGSRRRRGRRARAVVATSTSPPPMLPSTPGVSPWTRNVHSGFSAGSSSSSREASSAWSCPMPRVSMTYASPSWKHPRYPITAQSTGRASMTGNARGRQSRNANTLP